jgi:hypothetical protein
MKLHGDETFYIIKHVLTSMVESGSGSYSGVKLYTLTGAKTQARAINKRLKAIDNQQGTDWYTTDPALIFPVKLALDDALPPADAGLV